MPESYIIIKHPHKHPSYTAKPYLGTCLHHPPPITYIPKPTPPPRLRPSIAQPTPFHARQRRPSTVPLLSLHSDVARLGGCVSDGRAVGEYQCPRLADAWWSWHLVILLEGDGGVVEWLRGTMGGLPYESGCTGALEGSIFKSWGWDC